MRRRDSGTTLIELLIAVTLVSFLAVGIMTAMRVGLSGMTKSSDKLMANRRVAGTQRVLSSEIAGMMPVFAECSPDPSAPGPRYPFFEGLPGEMRFISDYSLQEGARGYPRLLEYRVIPGDRNEGVRLVVNELFYSGPPSLRPLCAGIEAAPETGEPVPRFRNVEVGPASFVLADRLAYCRLWYREELPPPEIERWVPVWHRSRFPTAIRVEMAPLDPDPARLQLGPVTVPVHVNRMMNQRDED